MEHFEQNGVSYKSKTFIFDYERSEKCIDFFF